MHLVETYATSTGLKIDKPEIYDAYIPLPRSTEKYISFQPFGSSQARTYHYWDEVMSILRPVLNENGIAVAQLGTPKERKINGPLDLRGATSINQAAYIIKNSMLHLGVDSFGIHFASGYQKKIVGLYSVMPPSESGPYWSDKKDVVLLEPDWEDGEKYSYSMTEDPMTINRIRPEDIAKAVCDLLDLKLNYPYKTLYIGSEYHLNRIEVVPTNYVGNWRDLKVDSLIVRMDKHFDLNMLHKQLSTCPCSIITNKHIDPGLIKRYKNNIVELVFFIDEKTDPNDVAALKNCGVKLFLLTKLSEEKLNKIKLNYVDILPVYKEQGVSKKALKKYIKGKDINNLYFKNSCLIIKNGGQIYNTYAESDKVKPLNRISMIDPTPVVDDPTFWEDQRRMMILEKTS